MKRAEEPVDINGDIHLVTEKLDAAERPGRFCRRCGHRMMWWQGRWECPGCRRRGEQRSIAAFYVICALIAAFAAGVWVDRWFQ